MRQILDHEYPGEYENGKFKRHDRVKQLIVDHAGVVMPFRALPPEAQCALIQYMALDGEAWELPDTIDDGDVLDPAVIDHFKKNLRDHLAFYVATYGDAEFGYIESLAMPALIKSVMTDAELRQDWGSWESYHTWYTTTGCKHTAPSSDKWPVILSDFLDETLQDGWTRFHQYAERGETSCPALFFLSRPATTTPEL